MAITLKCSCGKTLKVDEKYRGKKAKCPECGTSILVEDQDAGTGVQAEKPKRRPVDDEGVKPGKPKKRADPDDDDDEDVEDRKPIKKKKAKGSMSTMLIAGGCGGLFLLTCCFTGGGAAVWYFFFTGPGDDLKFVQEGAAGFVSIRAADGWKNPAVQDMVKQMPGDGKKEMDDTEAKFGMKMDDLERVTMVFRSTDFMNPDIGIIFKTTKAMDGKKIADAIGDKKGEKAKEVKHDGRTFYVFAGRGPQDGLALCFVTDRIALAGPKEDTIKDMLKSSKRPASHPALTRGLQLASSGRHQFVAAFEAKRDLMNNMGPMGANPQMANLQKTKGGVIAGALAKDLALEATLIFDGKDTAEKAKVEIDGLVGIGKLMGGGKGAPAGITKFIDSLKVEQSGTDVLVKGNLELDFKGGGGPFPFMPFGGGPGGGGPVGGGPIGGGPGRAQSTNNLKQIALAMHSFQDTFKSFPNHAIRDMKTGAPLLSWRVAILPFIDQQGLYKQIRLNEPWNSTHNLQFANQMPLVYLIPGKPNDGRTYYQVFHGNESIFPKSKLPATQNMLSGINFPSITDGTSNTILVVESAASIEWMRPDDIPFQKNDPALPARMGNHWNNNTFLAAMGDGTVRAIRRNLTPQTLKALVTRAGGEVVQDKDWMP